MKNVSVTESEKTELVQFIQSLADDARVILSDIGSNIQADAKVDKSLVTAADVEIEKRCRERIEQVFPQHGIIGEEYGVSNPGASFCWVLDPIDGTEEFVAGTPLFGSIMALHLDGRPLVALIDHAALDRRLLACKGAGVSINNKPLVKPSRAYPKPRVATSNCANFMRQGDESAVFESLHLNFPNSRIYSSCYAHSCTVEGGFDAMVEWNVKLWDLAATELLIVESGGKYVEVTSPEAAKNDRISAVFGSSHVVDHLCRVIEAA
ncbi:MAG: hypothetical protein KDD66_12970 [Bdellovibrionales bacterium]|nr:hypothetical protein [Bdellovibrionales bacterium]